MPHETTYKTMEIESKRKPFSFKSLGVGAEDTANADKDELHVLIGNDLLPSKENHKEDLLDEHKKEGGHDLCLATQDQGPTQIEIVLDKDVVSIETKDLQCFYQHHSKNGFCPKVELKYHEASIASDEQLRNKKYSHAIRLLFDIFDKLPHDMRLTEKSNDEIIQQFGPLQEFFKKIFNIANDFFPLHPAHKAFLDEIAEFANCKFFYPVLQEMLLHWSTKYKDPSDFLRNQDEFFKKTKIRSLFNNDRECNEFKMLCYDIAKLCVEKRKEKEANMHSRVKRFAESTFYVNSTHTERSFVSRVRELSQYHEVSEDDLKNIWANARRLLLDPSNLHIFAFGVCLPEIPRAISMEGFYPDMPKYLRDAIQERSTKISLKTTSFFSSFDPIMIKYFVLLAMVNFSFSSLSFTEMKILLGKLKEKDKSELIQAKIRFSKNGSFNALPMPVFLCLYAANDNFYKYIMQILGLDAFNAVFEFNKEEHNIISFLEKLQDLIPKKADRGGLDEQKKDFYDFLDKINIKDKCGKLKEIKKELECMVLEKEWQVKTNKPIKKEAQISTPSEASSITREAKEAPETKVTQSKASVFQGFFAKDERKGRLKLAIGPNATMEDTESLIIADDPSIETCV